MKRQVSLEEISDGRLYGKHDMVRAGCGDCKGCSDCCHGMGNSVILDPLDIWRMTTGLGKSFDQLLTESLALNVVDGVILPNLRMNDQAETCAYLNSQGRCSIHHIRPGICRLFPLGRYYEASNRSFRYFLQVHECPAPNKTKVKVEKWIDTPEFSRYEQFISQWHYFLEDVEKKLTEAEDDYARQINLYILKLFYMKPYEAADFYSQFAERLTQAMDVLEI